MSAGYGRGYYGTSQLALRRPSGGGGGGWIAIAVVVGLGALVWFMLPSLGPKPKHEEPAPTPAPAQPQPPTTNDEDLDQLARLRGFSSTKAFEDSVLANARSLKATGATVELAPHLQHLESRLEP